MRRARRRIFGIATTAALVVGGGCNNKPAVSTSTDEATVKGTVTIRGKKATQGQVTFDPANYQRKDVAPRSAPIGSDGTYSITTLTGQNSVQVSGPEASRAGADYASITYDVQPGENTYDIVYPPPDPQ